MHSNDNIVFTLNDNNKYVVVDTVMIDMVEYVYLADINNQSNVMFCQLEGNKLTRVVDKNIISKIMLQIYKQNHN